MLGYWKIEKEWVTDWGLSGNEALLLADLLDWPKATIEQRAQRVNMTGRSVINIIKRFRNSEKISLLICKKNSLNTVKNFHHDSEKISPKKVKKFHQNSEKFSPPPTPPYIEEQEEQEKNIIVDDETRARTREEEQAQNGVVKGIEELAEEVRNEIANGGTFAESAQRLYGILPDELTQYLSWFVDKLRIDGTNYKSRSDFRRHFSNWLRIQIDNKIKQQNNGQQQHGPSDDFIRRTAQQVAAKGGLSF